MQYLTGKDYPHLCVVCRAKIDTIAAQMTGNDPAIEAASLAVKIPVNPSDPEAPCDFLYDHAMFCGGRSCKGPWKVGDTVLTIFNQVVTLDEFVGGGGFWMGKNHNGVTCCPSNEDIKCIVGVDAPVSPSAQTLWIFYKLDDPASPNSRPIPFSAHSGNHQASILSYYARELGYAKRVEHPSMPLGGYYMHPQTGACLLCAPNGTDPRCV